ncbi:hypothetical protein [Nonomuraea recticatena]|uniref:Uncharacterized protein n=1 Tax=Nonomuraea recticatena TaxID=46178 RepID=A0ABN3STS9_9ACTN
MRAKVGVRGMSAVCRGNAVTQAITGTGGFSVAIAPDGIRAAAAAVIFWIWCSMPETGARLAR